MNFKNAITELRRGTVFLGTLMDTYFKLFNKEECRRRKDRVAFYSQFIRRRDLVFDIRANVGAYPETFLKLGARVVAVEPNRVA